jgi:hypothetical protein
MNSLVKTFNSLHSKDDARATDNPATMNQASREARGQHRRNPTGGGHSMGGPARPNQADGDAEMGTVKTAGDANPSPTGTEPVLAPPPAPEDTQMNDMGDSQPSTTSAPAGAPAAVPRPAAPSAPAAATARPAWANASPSKRAAMPQGVGATGATHPTHPPPKQLDFGRVHLPELCDFSTATGLPITGLLGAVVDAYAGQAATQLGSKSALTKQEASPATAEVVGCSIQPTPAHGSR